MERTIQTLKVLFLLLFVTAGAQAQEVNRLFVPDMTGVENSTITLPINLSNTNADIVAMQFELSVPHEAMVLNTSKAVLTDRKDDHALALSSLGLGRYRVMVYSPSNKPLKANSGAVIEISATIADAVDHEKVFPIELSDVVLSNSKGDNVATAPQNGTFRVKAGVDFTVSDISVSPASAMPGDSITVSWTVRNAGDIASTGGWSERVYLVSRDGTEKSLGTYNGGTQSLGAGRTVSRHATVAIPGLTGIDGDMKVRVTVVPDSGSGEGIAYQKNNTAETNGYPLNVGKKLTLELPASAIEEGVRTSVRCRLSRSGSWKDEQTFTLTKTSGDDRLVLPESVTIKEGQASAYFYITVSDNDVLDDGSVFGIQASGNGYNPVSSTLTIEDDEHPQLTLEASKTDIAEGETFQLTVTTERASAEPLVVSLVSEKPKRFSHPATITIPAGMTSATVDVTAVDNEEVELQASVMFKVSAEKYHSGECIIMLEDNDLPDIDLTLSPMTVSESAGPAAIVAKLRRMTNTGKKVTIQLSDDSNGDIFYPAKSIVLEAGVEEAQFSLGIIDNAMVDGDRQVNITAAVYVSSCSCSASGTSAGSVTKAIEIIDNDGPSLTVSASKPTLLEGNEEGITLTVTRNTSTESPLSVSISCDNDNGLSYEHNVTIPAGAKSTDVKVKALANSLSGDDRTLVFTVESDNFSKGTCWVMLTDQTLPDAQIKEITVSKSDAEVGSDIDVSVTISNVGADLLPELTKTGVYLGNSSSPVTYMYTQQALAPGEQVTLSKTITLPSAVGTYDIYAVANDGQAVKELLYVNNTSEKVAVKTAAPFRATVSVGKNRYQQGEEVKISGKISGNNTSNSDVEIYLINGGLRQTIKATADADGNFTATYQPYSAQMGHFTAGACYPGEGLTDEMASFDIYGLKLASTAAVTCEPLLGETYKGKISVVNPGVLPLTGVKATVVSQPDNYEVDITCPSLIEGGNTISVDYAITGKAISQGNDWDQIKIMLETNEQASVASTLYCYCRNPKGQLTTDVSAINTTMVKGATRDYPITITNIGKGETGKITLSLPGWMSVATPTEMASLAPGASTTAVLRLMPTDGMQLNVPVTGTIGINCENGNGIPLSYSIEPVSESTGTLTIDVCDEYTYYTAEAPHVAGAQVLVQHPITKVVLMSGISDEYGKCSFTLSEGYYHVIVTAPKHSTYEGNIMVNPGTETNKTVNLGINGISVDMRYEETEIEDEYHIVTTTKYETNVPVPVVETILPARIMADELQPGESLMFYAKLVNHGLITAQNTQIIFPEYLDDIAITVLGDNNFSLLPNQTVSIPVKVTKQTPQMTAKISYASKKGTKTCRMEEVTWYESECGEDRKIHTIPHTIQIKVCSPNFNPEVSPNRPISINGSWFDFGLSFPNGNAGSPNGNGGTVNNNESLGNIIADKFESFVCDPCVNKYMDNFAECNGWDPKHPIQSFIERIPIVGDIAGCGFDIYNNSYDKGEYMTLSNSGSALFKCALKACQSIGGILIGIGSTTAATGVGTAAAVGGAIAKAVCEILDKGTDKGDCINGFLEPCFDSQSVTRVNGTRTINAGYPSYITQFQDKMRIFVDGRQALQDYAYELLGFDEFQESDMAELSVLFDKIGEFPSGHIINMEEIELYKPENISNEVFAAFIERANNTTRRSLGQTVTGDFVDLSVIDDCRSRILKSVEAAKKYGYDGISDMLTDSYIQLLNGYENERQSVCASVTLSLSQTMTMTRKAIRGTLDVLNGHDTKSMDDIKLKLSVLDENGHIVGDDIMHVTAESLNGFSGQLDLQSGWSLSANSQGTATILFIPTKKAAPLYPKQYTFTGTLSYMDPFAGTEVIRELAPSTLTVNPSPNLDLTYFMQRDIYGDDPLTQDVVEPCKPAEFALLINNKGYGDATNVRMVTNQPEIVENEKGLLAEFEFLSSQLNGKDKTLALGGNVATDFGTIPAHSTAYAQWWLQSSLLGHFTDYDVKATHVTSYGNEDLSLLDNVTIHELIHGFTIDDKTDPKVRGFLVNDIVDAEDMPDMVYFTDGRQEEIVATASVNMTRNSETEYSVTLFPSEDGWSYGSVPDLTAGRQQLVSVVRQSDGKEMPADNFWLTDRTLRDGKDPLYEYRLHAIAELEGEETFILTFEPKPETELEVERFTGVPEEGTVLVTPLTSVGVTFNKEIEEATFTADDITLNREGAKVDLTQATITKVSGREYSIRLDGATLKSGYYVLTVQTAGITDTEGFAGATGKSVSWLQDVVETGISDNLSDNHGFSIHPLPIHDVMYVDGDFRVIDKLVVSDVSGSVRISEEKVPRGSAIDVTSLPTGIYIVSALTDNGKFIRKVLKK